ncbi:hypothetical protein KEM54_001792 [Ascosphaera aggregata]|nr:hypothetical protein KEM54_001792 [Ascosphaera aggregata]
MTALPPVPSRVFDSNHQFRALYAQLTGEKENAVSTGKPALLKPDGSTASLVEEANPVRTELHDCLVRSIRRKVLLNALRKVVAGGHDEAELAIDVREMLCFVLLYLQQPYRFRMTEQDAEDVDNISSTSQDSGGIHGELSQVLVQYVGRFKESIHLYVPALRSTLKSDVIFLKEMALAGTDDGSAQQPTERHVHSGKRFGGELKPVFGASSLDAISLVQLISERQASICNLQENLVPNARRRLATTTIAVIEAHARLLESSLLLLSRGKHGTLSRALKARAELLKTKAAGVDVQVQLKRAEILAKIYTSDVRMALERYHQHLLSIEDDLEMQKRKAMVERGL